MSAAHAVRPLPPQPSLEFERKEAKKLVRALRAGDADALARASLASIRSDRAQIQLADAQLVIAREYGFASWPKLVRYFTDAERLRHRPWPFFADKRSTYERHARWLMSGNDRVRARMLTAYVPRFYGLPEDVVADAVITEDEARLASARTWGFASWAVLMARSEEDEQDRARIDEGKERHYISALAAMRSADLAAVQHMVEQDPALLEPRNDESRTRRSLLRLALGVEVLADRARPRDALWIAAGLGDVDGVARHLDRNGAPRPSGYRYRLQPLAVAHVIRSSRNQSRARRSWSRKHSSSR